MPDPAPRPTIAAMATVWAIARRDLIQHFTTPLAWLILAVWTLVTNFWFWFYLEETRQSGFSSVPLYHHTLAIGSWSLVLLAPALTMNAFSSERVQGTFQLLLTVPISERALLLGKYLAALVMLLVLLAATLVQPLVLWFVSDLGGSQMLSGYLGMLLACLFLAALGTWISLLVDSPVAAYVLTLGVILMLFLVGILAGPRSGAVATAIAETFGLSQRLAHFRAGDLRLADIGWFVAATVGCLVLAHGALRARRIHG